MYSITISDMITSLDELFDFITYSIVSFVPPIIIIAGLLTTTTLAIRHYIMVKRLKKS